MSSSSQTVLASQPHGIMARNARERRTFEAFRVAPSLQPLVAGHMCKQDKSRQTFSKRYFALYEGGMLVYYTHQRDFESDVKKHNGIPLQCTLVKLDGLYLTRPQALYHGIKHSFTLHAPECSNHREEFLLVCRTKKDMRIWVEQLQSQNSSLAPGERVHKPPNYIQKLRLQKSISLQQKAPIDELDCSSLCSDCYFPGDIALKFHTDSWTTLSSTEPSVHIELEN